MELILINKITLNFKIKITQFLTYLKAISEINNHCYIKHILSIIVIFTIKIKIKKNHEYVVVIFTCIFKGTVQF